MPRLLHRRASIVAVGLLAACQQNPETEPTVQSAAKQRINAAELIGVDKTGAARILGEPSECHTEKAGESCAYSQATDGGKEIEVFFVDDRAANLTLPNYGLRYEPRALAAYGIEAGEPDFVDPAVMRWQTKIGSKSVEVSMFPDGGGGIFYVYVKSVS